MTQETEPQEYDVALADNRLTYVEWHADQRGKGPTLLFLHATGFHARIWDQVVARLPARHTICLNLRGHGGSTGGPLDRWTGYADEVAEVIRRLDLTRIVGIGHSVGGHILVPTALALPERFERLMLIDPVIMPPQLMQLREAMYPEGYVHPTTKRRNEFASVEDMIDRFRDRAPYAVFDPQVLEDYCTHGLRPEGDGFVLRCSPVMEGGVYVRSMSNPGIYDMVKQVPHPVLILRANPPANWGEMDFSASPTWDELAGLFPDGHEEFLPHLTHFIPMQDPDLTADRINGFVAQGAETRE